MELPNTHVLSVGSKAHMEPSGKFVCRGPIQHTASAPFRQNPQPLAAICDQENATRKVAARFSP